MTLRYGNYWKQVSELRSAVEAMRAEGYNVVALVGHSKGGNVVLMYQSQFNDVPLVVNVR